jgi:hypothetical protein
MRPLFVARVSACASILVALSVTLAFTLGGCASSPKNSASKPTEISADHPSIVNARAEPEVVTLNRDLQPNQEAEVLADVKDFKANVVSVTLKFRDIPLEVPLENIGGTTWRAALSPQELQSLAVSGRTVRYKADIIARDDRGEIARSPDAINIEIQAPDLGHGIG